MGTVTVLAPLPQPRHADPGARSLALQMKAFYGSPSAALAVLARCRDENRLAQRVRAALKGLT